MTDRIEVLHTIIGTLRTRAANAKAWSDGSRGESTALSDLVDSIGDPGADDQITGMKIACETACGVDLTAPAREGANTIGQLTDVIVTALMIPVAATPIPMRQVGSLTLAIHWTGENEGVIAIGADQAEALSALGRAHPELRTDRIEYVEAHAQAGGGWSAVLDG